MKQIKEIVEASYEGIRLSPAEGFYLEMVNGIWYTRNNEACTSICGILTQKNFVISPGEFSLLEDASCMGLFYGSCVLGSICAKHTDLVFPIAKKANYCIQRAGTSTPITMSIYAPLCTQAWNALADMPLLTDIKECYLPLVERVEGMLGAAGLTEFNHALPSAQIISNFAVRCPKIVTVRTEFSKATIADSAFLTTPLLKTVTPCFSSLSSGVDMFKNSGLEADMINAVLESLPFYTSGSHIITFTGCPGAASCSPEIATRKGWTVQI